MHGKISTYKVGQNHTEEREDRRGKEEGDTYNYGVASGLHKKVLEQ